ncbi:MAG: glycosyltransferase family 8 protein [Bacteroidota bacterium]
MKAPTHYFDIAFNLDHAGLLGAGATITSLLNHCSAPQELRLNFLHLDLADYHQESIRQLLRRLNFRGEHRFLRFNVAEELYLIPSFFDSYANYGRLFLAELLDGPRVLYLDTDLLVNCDVLPLRSFDLAGHLIGAVTRGPVANAYDRQFYQDRGWPKDTPYFNAGVLLFDLEAWRSAKINQQWKAMVRQHADAISCFDQTILNGVFNGTFCHLPQQYNIPFNPASAPPAETEGIYHFNGSPKPWDFLGAFLHKGYRAWRTTSPPSWETSLSIPRLDRWKRAWSIRRSILRFTQLSIKKRFG